MVAEGLGELFLITFDGFKSKHDDFVDTMSMLSVMKPWKPSQTKKMEYNETTSVWEEEDITEDYDIESYLA